MPEGTGAAPATGGEGAKPEQGPQGQPDQSAAAGAAPETPATGATEGLGEAGKLAIERERDKAKTERAARLAVEAELRTLREKDLPEAEKAARRLAELETENAELKRQYQEGQVRTMVETAAAKAGFADPGDAFRLLDTASLKRDHEGNPIDVDKAVKELLTSKPYLASAAARPTGSGDAGNTGGLSPGAFDMNAQLRRAAGRGN